ncbi:MAG: acylneuraminate cytidylyltransferase family protein [Rhodobacteraceae bacterium]|nr:acylneuraminate cytidylyltransferase family protein [Paracoccaceae bacterium]
MTVAIIPARSGSKGLPGKNVLELGGYPLIAWTVFSAIRSGLFDEVFVSTDSENIAAVARAAGASVPFLRPEELASDESVTREVVAHVLTILDIRNEDWFALLQPTSPFRNSSHIRAAVDLLDGNTSSVVSVTDEKPLSWAFEVSHDGTLSPALPRSVVSRRQSTNRIVRPNGAVYVQMVGPFRSDPVFFKSDTKGYKMSQIDSIDIDDTEDFALAEAVVAQGLRVPEI